MGASVAWGCMSVALAFPCAALLGSCAAARSRSFASGDMLARLARNGVSSGAAFDQESVGIDIMGLPVCRQGLTVPFDEEEALRRFESPDVVIDINLGAGDEATTMWTCDFSHEYVTINGDYRS